MTTLTQVPSGWTKGECLSTCNDVIMSLVLCERLRGARRHQTIEGLKEKPPGKKTVMRVIYEQQEIKSADTTWNLLNSTGNNPALIHRLAICCFTRTEGNSVRSVKTKSQSWIQTVVLNLIKISLSFYSDLDSLLSDSSQTLQTTGLILLFVTHQRQRQSSVNPKQQSGNSPSPVCSRT